jgi:ABC-type glycerol-3-phosphate transport system permease component
LLYGAAVILSVGFAGPFLWAVITSLKSATQVNVFPPVFVPDPVAVENWLEVWEIVPLARFIGNTVIVTTFSLMGQLLSTSLVAYGFARFRFPLRNFLFLIVLSSLMLPQHITLVPRYVLFKELGWIDTYLPLVVPWWFAAGGGGAFGIFLLRQFFMTIPMDLDEAAKLDGASYLRIYWEIILPLTKPALAALAVFGFLWHWNDFLEPLIYLNSSEKFTISIGLNYLRSSGFVGMGVTPVTEHYLMAAALIATIPPLALFLIAQRQFIQGINLTGLKG